MTEEEFVKQIVRLGIQLANQHPEKWFVHMDAPHPWVTEFGTDRTFQVAIFNDKSTVCVYEKTYDYRRRVPIGIYGVAWIAETEALFSAVMWAIEEKDRRIIAEREDGKLYDLIVAEISKSTGEHYGM